MTLIKSISGIRGTIGGQPGDNFTPVDIVKFTAAYGTWLQQQKPGRKKVVTGRDGRASGAMVKQLVIQTLLAMGIDVIDLDLSTTPTVEIAVPLEQADGGIILTASHNPVQWNALKLLNEKGEFISGADGEQLLSIAATESFTFADITTLGNYTQRKDYIARHVALIGNYPLVNIPAIRDRRFTVVVDAINSTGAIAVPLLLEALGIARVIVLNETINGLFAHNPEPLPEHLVQLSDAVKTHQADFGIAVDPDVDRLCFVCEDGSLFGEEYTLVAIADYILSHRKGSTVSNLSSTMALKDITEKHGCVYHAAAVGEVNVVTKMKAVEAVIGGEGNGGVIIPDFHYGRDALIGIALFASALAERGGTVSEWRATYPDYQMVKSKMELQPGTDMGALLNSIQQRFSHLPHSTEDGVKIIFPEEGWVHFRQSNTEPIIRIYAEAATTGKAEELIRQLTG
jgi:phosphomannomutase